MAVCEVCGQRHFGRWGAAGLLLVRRDATRPGNPPTEVLLHHRSAWTDDGNTWALPGGALDRGETPRQGAIREAEEEISLPRRSTRGPDPLMIVRQEVAILNHGTWRYTYVIADILRDFEPRITDGEGLGVEWVPVGEVHQRQLHPSFAEAWPRLLQLIYPPLVDTDHQMSDVGQGDQGVLQDDGHGVFSASAHILDEDDDEDILSQAVLHQNLPQNDDHSKLDPGDQDAVHPDVVQHDNSQDTGHPVGVERNGQGVAANDDHDMDGQDGQDDPNDQNGPSNKDTGIQSQVTPERPAPAGSCRDYWQDHVDGLRAGNQARGLPMVCGPQGRNCAKLDHIAFRAMYDLGVPRFFYREVFAFVREVVEMDRLGMVTWARRTLRLALAPNDSKFKMLQDIILNVWASLDEENVP